MTEGSDGGFDFDANESNRSLPAMTQPEQQQPNQTVELQPIN